MIMTGRLGVFRIQGTQEELIADTETILPTLRECEIWWDTIDLESRFGQGWESRLWRHRGYDTDMMHPLDVFILPVRIMQEVTDKFYYQISTLKGLLLLPTGLKSGESRRVGLMQAFSYFESQKCFSRPKVFMARTEISNQQYYESKDDCCNYRITIV